jgi:hypothetical protein
VNLKEHRGRFVTGGEKLFEIKNGDLFKIKNRTLFDLKKWKLIRNKEYVVAYRTNGFQKMCKKIMKV